MAKDIDIQELVNSGLVDNEQLRQEAIKRGIIKDIPKSTDQYNRVASGQKLPWYEIDRNPKPTLTDKFKAFAELSKSLMPGRDVYNYISDVAGPGVGTNPLSSIASGLTASLSDYPQAALRQRQSQYPIDTSIRASLQALKTGQNVPNTMKPMTYDEALQQVRSEQGWIPKAVGMFAPQGAVTQIGRGYGALADKLFKVGGKGLSTLQNVVRAIPSGATAGAATGATLTALGSLEDPSKADYSIPTILSSVFGAVGKPLQVGGKILEDNASKAAIALNDDIKTMLDANRKEKVISIFRDRWQKSGGKELSEQQVFDIVKNSYNNFKNKSYNIFESTLGKYLTDKRSIPKQTQQAILGVLNKNGLIEKNPETGKFVFETIGKGFYPQPVKSNIAQQGIVVGKTLPKEQEELFRAYKSISTPQNQSTKSMQDLKIGYSSQANFDKEGANRISKTVQANLKKDILAGVESQFGKRAKNIVAKAYEQSASDMQTQKIFKKALGENFTLDQNNIEQFYKKFSQNFLDNTTFRRSLLKTLSKKDASAITEDLISKTMRNSLNTAKNFVPKRFMAAMNNMNIGTPKGKLEKLVQDGLLSTDDYRQLKRLYNFSEQLDKKGLTEFSLTGMIMDGADVNVGTTLQRFIGPNARQIFTRTGLINRALEKAQKDLISKENIKLLGKGLQKSGGALKSGQSSAIINQLINSGE